MGLREKFCRRVKYIKKRIELLIEEQWGSGVGMLGQILLR